MSLQNKAEAVAAIALDIPPAATTADILRALNAAFDAGRRYGHYEMNRAMLLDTLSSMPELRGAA